MDILESYIKKGYCFALKADNRKYLTTDVHRIKKCWEPEPQGQPKHHIKVEHYIELKPKLSVHFWEDGGMKLDCIEIRKSKIVNTTSFL